MITGINELKRITKHLSCECKCRFEGRKCKKMSVKNADVSVKKIAYVKKIMLGILLHIIV